MKSKGLVIFLVSLLLIVTAMTSVADEKAERLESVVLESFDNPESDSADDLQARTKDWVVLGSKFSSEEPVSEGSSDIIEYPIMKYVNKFPQSAFGYAADPAGRNSLGIHAKWDRKGYNHVEIIPGERSDDGTFTVQPIEIPGKVQIIDMWVWGSNYQYDLEVHVQDYQGVTYVLDAGRIDFLGWKNMKVLIPVSIPQERKHLPQFQGLVLTKIVISTIPSERVDNFYVYIDHIKCLTDLHEDPYDGSDLTRQEVIDEIWSEGE